MKKVPIRRQGFRPTFECTLQEEDSDSNGSSIQELKRTQPAASSFDLSSLHEQSKRGTPYSQPILQQVTEVSSPKRGYDTGISNFTSIISPLVELKPIYSNLSGEVEFKTRRKNKVVTLQWEPFYGHMAHSGHAFLNVAQAIGTPPPYPLEFNVPIKHNGVLKHGWLIVDPFHKNHTLKFFINHDRTSTGINTGDKIEVSGHCVHWIVD
jgi:hypothetical protein